MYVLEDLWRGNITPAERGYPENGPFAELVQRSSESEGVFYKELSAAGKRAYEVHGDLQAQLDDLRDCDTFIRGFRLGARMILDVVGHYDSPMLQINEMG